MKSIKLATLLLFVTNYLTTVASPVNGESSGTDDGKRGSLLTERVVSTILKDNRVGVDPNRTIKVYLPPGYEESSGSYPVVYYLHSIFQNPEKLLEDGRLISLLERGFESGATREFILVVPDYSTSSTGTLYENSKSTGRWLDFTIDEVVPFVDSHFRTLPKAESRGLVGDMMGGRGVFQLGMRYPDIFSCIYAMNPVGTALGLLPMPAYPDWRKIHQAKSFSELSNDHISQIFITMSQAFLPNESRPPFYCNFLMEMVDGTPTLQPENAQILMDAFLVDHGIDNYQSNLHRLRGIAFDWARYDPIQDHVYGSQALSRKLESFGIAHEAEEYRGVAWEENWRDYGRFYTRVLPFLSRNLVFE